LFHWFIASLCPISTPLLQLHGKTLSVRFLSSGVSQTRDSCCLLRSSVSQLFIIFSDENDQSSFFIIFILRHFTTYLNTSIIVIDTNLLIFMTFSLDIIPLKVKVSWCSNCKCSPVHSLDVGARQESFSVLPWELYQLQKVYIPQWIMRGWFDVLARR